jgi:hypothetical protein
LIAEENSRDTLRTAVRQSHECRLDSYFLISDGDYSLLLILITLK